MKCTEWNSIGVLASILSLAVLLTACGGGREAPSPAEGHVEDHDDEAHEEGVVELQPAMLERVTIRTAQVALRALPAELQTTGKVDFEQDRLAHVTPRIPGRVEQVRADLGATIRQGQILAIIDSIELGRARADYLQARAHEDVARQNAEREAGLFAERISSEMEMLAARAEHLEAVARLRNAQETLRLYGLGDEQIEAMEYDERKTSLLPVRSPLAGRIVEKHVTVGELVTPERNMFTIADLGRVWIWIDVYERDLGNVHLEDDVAVEVDAFPGERFIGQVSYLSDQVDADTRTVRARIDADNPERKLRPGMFARVTLTDPHSVEDGAEPTLVIPTAAVQRAGPGFVVFVALGPRRFEARTVVVGRRAGGSVEILDGLSPGDAVVVEGAFLLVSEASKERMGAGHDH